MNEYQVIVHCRKSNAIGIFENRVFVVRLDYEIEPTRLQIIEAWERQWGCLSDDEAYQLHHVVSWKKVD